MKTKAHLLEVMSRMPTCIDAMKYVQDHPCETALEIGLTCPHTDWLVWFLYRRLTYDGLLKLTERLGLVYAYELWEAGLLPSTANALDRRVIDDCWAAWCRADPKTGRAP